MEVLIYKTPYSEFINKSNITPGILSDYKPVDGIIGIGKWMLFTVAEKHYAAVTIEPAIINVPPFEFIAEVPKHILNIDIDNYIYTIIYSYLVSYFDATLKGLPKTVRVGIIKKKDIPNPIYNSVAAIMNYLIQLHPMLKYRPTSIIDGANIIKIFLDIDDEEVPYIG